MKIEYCESCGMRVPEKDLESGTADREGGKVTCATCRSALSEPASGSTPRMLPAGRVSRATSAKIIPAARSPRRTSGIRTVRPVERDDPSSARIKAAAPSNGPHHRHPPSAHAHAAPRSSGVPTGLIIGGIGLALIIFGLLLLTNGGSTSPAAQRDHTAAAPRSEPVPATVAEPAEPTPSMVAQPSRDAGAHQTPAAAARIDREAVARNAWDSWLDETPAEDWAARQARVDAFLEAYGDTIVAAQARLEREKIQARMASVAPAKSPDGPVDTLVAEPAPEPDKPEPPAKQVTPALPEQPPEPDVAVKPRDPLEAPWFALQVAVAAGDYEAASQTLAEARARAGEDAAMAEGVAELEKDLARVKQVREAAALAVRAQADKTVRVQRERGILSGKVLDAGAEHTVALKVTGGQLVIIPAAELRAEDVVAWTSPKEGEALDAETALGHGLAWMAEGETQKAKEAFDRAGAAGATADAARLTARLPWLERLPAESEARAGWQGVDKQTHPGLLVDYDKALAAEETVKAWRETHQKTSTAEALAPVVDERLQAIVDIKKRLVPQAPGLVGQYFKDKKLRSRDQVLVRIDRDLNFDFSGQASNGVPAQFGARWTGFLMAPAAGEYAMRIRNDDGVRVFLDGQQVVHDYKSHSPLNNDFKANLKAGPNSIRIEYFNGASGGECKLYWKAPGATDLAVVPEAAFTHNPETIPAISKPAPTKLPDGPIVYLCKLKPVQVVNIFKDELPKPGMTIENKSKIMVMDTPSPNGLFTHPESNKTVRVVYRLQKAFKTFRATVGLHDQARRAGSKLIFRVKCNDRVVWESKSVEFHHKVQPCVVDVRGVDTFEISVECTGGNSWAHAVWVEPHLLR